MSPCFQFKGKVEVGKKKRNSSARQGVTSTQTKVWEAKNEYDHHCTPSYY